MSSESKAYYQRRLASVSRDAAAKYVKGSGRDAWQAALHAEWAKVLGHAPKRAVYSAKHQANVEKKRASRSAEAAVVAISTGKRVSHARVRKVADKALQSGFKPRTR
jgi:hypothetical protein